jgi:uncharacterized membrane protein YhfC
MVGMPVALAAYLIRRFHLGWRLVWIGAATFVISQVGHIPFNALLTRLFQVGIFPHPPTAWIPFFNPVVLGLSAGLFEELSRTAVYAWWAKDARSWRRGVLFGVGHGGIESAILGGLVLYTFLQMVSLRDIDLAKIIPADQLQLAQQQMSAYWSAPWYASLLGAVERFFTIPFQICLSVIVLQAFTRRQPAWVILAVFVHALTDAVSVYLLGVWKGQLWSPYAIEGVIGFLALIGVVILFTLRQPEPKPDVEIIPVPAPPLSTAELKPVESNQEINPDKLDQSKYM